MKSLLQSSILSSASSVEHGFGTSFREVDPADSTFLEQKHSDLVFIATRPGAGGEGDALVTNRPNLALSIRTADCYPILLADTLNRAVAAIHAGWRGTAAHIVRKTLEKMRSEFGTLPANVHAAIGPGIGVCCYEVGIEVAREFGRDGRTHLDLALENRNQLEEAGVPTGNIEALGMCTFCNAERFFSYRRDKDNPGRMTSFIRIASEIKPR
jgi:YfiH family protein